MASEPKSLPELVDHREVGLTIVGLVEDVKVLPGETHAAEAVGAAFAVGAADQVRPLDAALAAFAVRAPEACRAARGVRALGAVDAAVAVVRARDVGAVAEEGRVTAPLAPLAAEAAHVGGALGVGREELTEALLEVGRGEGRHGGHLA